MKRENGFSVTAPVFASRSDSELNGFAGGFIPGGHAPLTDLGDNRELGRVLRHFHDNGKPTAAVVCHGLYAFLPTDADGGGEFPYKSYKVTSWSNTEEGIMETVLGGEIPKVETALPAKGVDMVEGVGKSMGLITVDREVASGANPMAAGALGEQF